MTLSSLLPPVLFVFVGLAAGTLHFGLLKRNADLFVQGRALPRALGLLIARIALTVAVLIVAVRFGAWSLLSCALGILMARQAVMWHLGRAPR